MIYTTNYAGQFLARPLNFRVFHRSNIWRAELLLQFLSSVIRCFAIFWRTIGFQSFTTYHLWISVYYVVLIFGARNYRYNSFRLLFDDILRNILLHHWISIVYYYSNICTSYLRRFAFFLIVRLHNFKWNSITVTSWFFRNFYLICHLTCRLPEMEINISSAHFDKSKNPWLVFYIIMNGVIGDIY